MTKRSKLEDMIRRDLGYEEALEEAYVAMPKQYDLNTEFLSSKAKSEHRKLYERYADTVSKISAKLDSVDYSAADGNSSAFRSLKKDEVYNLNATYLHELHFANISDVNSQISMDSLSFMRLSRDFGDFDTWQNDFMACAKAARNGWAITAYSTFLRRYVNFFVDSHDLGALVGCYPIIVLDVWEHAYYKDYVTERETYIRAMMKEFDWNVIEERIKRADRIAKALE